MTQAPAESDLRGAACTDDVDLKQVRQIAEKHADGRGKLIAALQDIQTLHGYLPESALRLLAEATGNSLVDIYGIATFYRSFTLQPRGKHLICACLGTACHVRGAPNVVREFERQLGIGAGETTSDKEFTLETVNCLGACALGPVLVIDGHYFSKVRKSKVRHLLDMALSGFDKEAGHDRSSFAMDVSCPRCNRSLMDDAFPIDGRPSICCSVSFNGRHGWLRLSSVYGSVGIAAEHAIPPETVVRFFCPHCHMPLIGRTDCPTCEAPMVSMLIQGGGVVRICSRRGCENRELDLM